MAYIVEADIEGELSYSIAATTQPTSTEVETIISDIEAEVDGVLYAAGVNVAGISLAATPISFKVVRQWALWGACSRVLAAAGGLVFNQGGKEEMYWERFKEKAKTVLANPRILGSDVPFASSGAGLDIGGLKSTDDDYDDRVFDLDDEF